MMTVKIDKFLGKEYSYLHNTHFLVQIQAKDHAEYKNVFSCYGDLSKAGKKYISMLPIPNHKKRIIMVGNLGETIIHSEKFK